MTRRLSIRWRLFLSTFMPVLLVTGGLVLGSQVRTRDHLLSHLEKTLETECDEVLSVLQRHASSLTVEMLFAIETSERFSPYSYFYQIADGGGRVLIKSDNLGSAALPVPRGLVGGERPVRVVMEDAPLPPALAHTSGETMRVRSERVSLLSSPWGGEPLLVQVAVSLWPVEATMRRHLIETVFYALTGLAAVLVLLWSVIARALWPVAHLTERASSITATSLRERLPRSGADDELDRLTVVLNGMLDGLQQSLQQMEEFTSDAAHQLRTPLTRIRCELDLILRSGLPEATRGELERVQEELERLTRTCGRLLLLARLDQEGRESVLFADRVDMREVVCELIEQLTPLAQERAVELTYGQLAAAEVRGSRQLIVEALLNLVHNAMRFAGAGGNVEVSLSSDASHVTIAVSDSGPGIPYAEHEKIFRRFYRPAGGANDGEGTGLGLAIVKAIARAHGGAVDLVSAPGRGSCFRLAFPVLRAA